MSSTVSTPVSPASVSLAGRRIVVTGAARGLGLEIARYCAQAGARLWLIDILEEGREAADSLAAEGGEVHFSKMDLADPDNVASVCAEVASEWGGLDGLVNNAAIATNVGGKVFEDIDLALWDRVQTVNVRGTWLVTKAFSLISPQLAGSSTLRPTRLCGARRVFWPIRPVKGQYWR